MLYRTHTPQAPLSDFVHTLWLYEGPVSAHTKERKLPDGTMELIINLHDDVIPVYDRKQPDHCQTFRGSLLCGAHSTYSIIDTATQTSVVGVHFKVGGTFPFFNLPAGELHNAHLSLDNLWGNAAIELREQLLATTAPENKFHILQHALLTQLFRHTLGHPAVTFAIKKFQQVSTSPHPQRIADVTDRIGLSSKQFIQLFKEQVGLTPKLFCRVQRFQKALHLIRSRQQVEWMRIALDCGYFDQAHFIHDFHEFSGLTPGAYLLSQGIHHNHVPLSN